MFMHGVRQVDLAAIVGCSQRFVSAVLTRKAPAPLEFKQRAAKFFGLPIADLFDE
jgi:antitoxin component HigA of HigAB toxin-antitoxin module